MSQIIELLSSHFSLFITKFSQFYLHNIRVQFEMWDSDDPVPRVELLKKVKGCDGILCVLTEKIDAQLLNAAG